MRPRRPPSLGRMSVPCPTEMRTDKSQNKCMESSRVLISSPHGNHFNTFILKLNLYLKVLPVMEP